jgi:hypothetical protein
MRNYYLYLLYVSTESGEAHGAADTGIGKGGFQPPTDQRQDAAATAFVFQTAIIN